MRVAMSMAITANATTIAMISFRMATLAKAPTTVNKHKSDISNKAIRADMPRRSRQWCRWPRSVV